MINKLINLANRLDEEGLAKEADKVDALTKEAFLLAMVCGLAGCKSADGSIGWEYEWDILKYNIVGIKPKELGAGNYADSRVKILPYQRDTKYPRQGDQTIITWKCAAEPEEAGEEDGPAKKSNEYEGDLLDITYVWTANMPAMDRYDNAIHDDEGPFYRYSEKPLNQVQAPSACGDWDEVELPALPNVDLPAPGEEEA